jgi:hypothetical protein
MPLDKHHEGIPFPITVEPTYKSISINQRSVHDTTATLQQNKPWPKSRLQMAAVAVLVEQKLEELEEWMLT